ncbi:AP-4 complex subunit epsilon-1 [Clarias magur]|uniref:AP-4 complex subunit epsilon-1 n=1 Tax=Clarias magur TaxID=1594786 RepID=A0A8J4TUG0_CLAMG|nr:AP-4 complex subunit epsilon-1 [Clarias magur]
MILLRCRVCEINLPVSLTHARLFVLWAAEACGFLNEASRPDYCGRKCQRKMENSEPASGSGAIQMSLPVCRATGMHRF